MTSAVVRNISPSLSSSSQNEGVQADTYHFSFLPHLLTTHRFGIPPSRPYCPAYRAGHCPLGSSCPDKHPLTHSTNNLVCKHWLKGLCKKGDACDFLHEWNLRGRSECRQWASTGGYCVQGDDCNYLHPDLDIIEERKRPLCEWYERGFCPLGPRCAKRHVSQSKICPLYLAGFCPNGRKCKLGAHARWREDKDLPKPEVRVERTQEEKERERERMRLEAEEREVRDWERGEGRGRGRESRGGDSNHMTEERAVTIKYAAEVKSLRMPSIEADPSLGHD